MGGHSGGRCRDRQARHVRIWMASGTLLTGGSRKRQPSSPARRRRGAGAGRRRWYQRRPRAAPFRDARLHLFDRSNAGRLGGTSREEVLGLIEDRSEDQPTLVVDANVDLAAWSQLELLAQRSRNCELTFAAHRQGGMGYMCKAARVTPPARRRARPRRPGHRGTDAAGLRCSASVPARRPSDQPCPPNGWPLTRGALRRVSGRFGGPAPAHS
jgi:hypothetical protein